MNEAAATPRSSLALAVLALLMLALFAGLLALGNWQLQRRVWKLDLIDRVTRQLHAEPASIVGRQDWAPLDASRDEYRRLRLHGRLDAQHAALVQAVTERGPGFWVLSPLQLDDGSWVFLNRGFVDAAHRDPAGWNDPDNDQPLSLTGLLRRSEPGGAFLRRNDPAASRWYSRDVAALAQAAGLPAQRVAPFFVDLEAGPPQAWPQGGLTVLRFHNSHLIYALTWYSLAAMVAAGAVLVLRRERQLRQSAAS